MKKHKGSTQEAGASLWAGDVLFSGVGDTYKHFFLLPVKSKFFLFFYANVSLSNRYSDYRLLVSLENLNILFVLS